MLRFVARCCEGLFFQSLKYNLSSMTYSSEHIIEQLSLGEDSHWEFKQVVFEGDRPKSPSPDNWADEMAAFANTSGGVLLCGVTDGGEVQGMSIGQMDELERLLVEVSSNSIKPSVRINTFRKKIRGKGAILLVEIPEGSSQHDSPGGSFCRVGSSKRKMTSDERLRLAQNRGQSRFLWFDKQTVPETGFETLSRELWNPLLSAESAVDPELALVKMGLLAEDETGTRRATVAGVLLCSESPELLLPNASVMATFYLGKDRASKQADARVIGGPVNRQIADAVAFVLRNMKTAARKEPARVDMPQYSERAVFEAVVNAVVHRDYSVKGSRIRLSMFEDRLEILSPGALPNNLTVDSMDIRQSTRNEILASVLGRMPVGGARGSGERQFFMERRGDGVPIIRRETRELCGKHPEYRLIDGSDLCLTIPAASLEAEAASPVITVRHSGRPLPGTSVLVLFPNKTWKLAATDENGEATVSLHSIHLPMTVFVAAEGFAAHVERDWVPAQASLAVELETLPEGGSVIFAESTGKIPGLKGRLNPIRDTHDRTYLYASNIAIEKGKQQPVHFTLGEGLILTDSDGREMLVRIIEIFGRSCLVEYRGHAKLETG
ncbi:MAG: hypothetical protein F4Z13_01025 [Candidatus Dadabacteria bacterium]|nr:hypothetical protein [Candidatus Dadabacteria bacterium]